MTNSELLSLREQVLKDVMPLVLESTNAGPDRFSLLLRIIQAGNASSEIYKRAYETANKIEDSDDRLQALLSLLDEIDIDANQQQTQEEGSGSIQDDTEPARSESVNVSAERPEGVPDQLAQAG